MSYHHISRTVSLLLLMMIMIIAECFQCPIPLFNGFVIHKQTNLSNHNNININNSIKINNGTIKKKFTAASVSRSI